MFTRPVNKIPYDEEIVDESRAGNDREFIVELLAEVLVIRSSIVPIGATGIVVRTVTFFEPCFAKLEKV